MCHKMRVNTVSKSDKLSLVRQYVEVRMKRMNLIHRYLCRSAAWEKTLRTSIIPWALDGIDLSNKTLEVGPGPGLTTDILRHLTNELTCIEIDPIAADSLRKRMSGTDVTVQHGD